MKKKAMSELGEAKAQTKKKGITAEVDPTPKVDAKPEPTVTPPPESAKKSKKLKKTKSQGFICLHFRGDNGVGEHTSSLTGC